MAVSRASIEAPKHQRGIVLLGIIIVIVLGALAYFVSKLSVVDIRNQQLEATSKSLQSAKQALISYAITYGDNDSDIDTFPDFPGEYGFLPCPDYNNGLAEGVEDSGNCGAQGKPVIGFFPWKTLDVPVLKDDSGTCLLYAVTGDYKNDESGVPSNKTAMLNEDTNGMFQIVDKTDIPVQGLNPQDRFVAIIFAPQEPLENQGRDFAANSLCGRDYVNYDSYLDLNGATDNSMVSDNANTVDQFIHATGLTTGANENSYNDRFITITRDEIWSAIVARTDVVQKLNDLTEALAMCLSNYAISNALDRFPWPAPNAMNDYRISNNYDDDVAVGYSGRYPFLIDDSNGTIAGANISDELFTEAACNNLVTVLSGSGATVDLQTVGAEYRVLWENWKDHFFYVVSQGYSPAGGSATCGNCIAVDGVARSAMVVFTGFRSAGQIRNEPIGSDQDTKFNASNYMENLNNENFPDVTGSAIYSTVGTNDTMYCLTTETPPLVIQC